MPGSCRHQYFFNKYWTELQCVDCEKVFDVKKVDLKKYKDKEVRCGSCSKSRAKRRWPSPDYAAAAHYFKLNFEEVERLNFWPILEMKILQKNLRKEIKDGERGAEA
jgi:hypothetical protein